jgi:erythromycin esterase
MRRAALLVLVACASSTPKPAPKQAPTPPPVTPAVVAPDPHNLGFEQVEGSTPKVWQSSGSLTAVVEDKHGGTRSLRLDGHRAASSSIDATPFRGKRIVVRGWIKTAESSGAGLWVRADADKETLVIDNMNGRYVTGTQPWTPVRVEIPVDAKATTVQFGALQIGSGSAWYDDLVIEEGEAPKQIVLAGSVLDAAGAPAAGAEVTLIDHEQAVTQHVQTDAKGHFEVTVLAGTWGLSAHRTGGVGAFVALTKYDTAKTDVKIALGKDGGVTVHGKVSNKVPPNTYLQISPFSDNDADLFAVPVAADGTFEAVLPRGDKYYVAMIGGTASGQFDRKGDRVDVVLETPLLDPPPAEVVAYIGKQGIALKTVEAGNGLDDMAPLAKLVGKAKIVALGEATHGSREIFQMKHRFLEYLVEKQGFSVFAIEANQPECRAVNDYVLTGKGTAKEALAGIYFWTWNTEEVLAMIEWMRAYNADAKHKTKVQFTGFDMQTSHVAHANVAAAVKKAVPDRADALLAPIAPLGERSSDPAVKKLSPDERKALTDALAALKPVLAKADADTRHDLRVLEQAAAMYMEKTPFDARDRAMAENVGWLLDKTKGRIVVWAHNGHIAKQLETFKNMGSQLKAKYKADYLPIGFIFGEGSFQAQDWSKETRRLGEITLGPAPEHYVTGAFAKTGKPLLVLDLRKLPKGKVGDWFAAKHPTRETGAVFNTEMAMTSLQALPPRFDAVIYIDKTTRARPVTK